VGQFLPGREWWRVRAETNAGHEMVERHDLYFLKPNPAWIADTKPMPSVAVGGLHELVQQQIAPGQNAKCQRLPAGDLAAAGARSGRARAGVFDMAAGSACRRSCCCTPGPMRRPGMRAGSRWTATALRASFAAQRATARHGTVFQRTEVNLLDPAPGATILAGLGRTPA
jgi:hypothetical protein